METIYTIRTRVLDMPMDMWVKFRDLYGEVEIFETTKPQFFGKCRASWWFISTIQRRRKKIL